jgi:molybdopterin synthase catalytic subunit
MTLVLRAALTDQPISLAEHEDLVSHQSAGAIVGFDGMVRDHDGARGVARLEYSAHPTAAQVLADAVTEVAEQSTGVRAVAASHRVGVLQIGDAALVDCRCGSTSSSTTEPKNGWARPNRASADD